MNENKKKGYPATTTEDNRFKNQDEFDNAPREDRMAEQHPEEGVKTSTAPPDADFRDVEEEDAKK